MITAKYKDESTDTIVSEDVWQWDWGQTLRIEGLPCIESITEIDFATSPQWGTAIAMVGVMVDGGLEVSIPDSILACDKQENYNVYAFTMETSAESGETTHRIRIPVIARPKRENYEGSSTSDPFGDVVENVTKLAEEAKEAATNAQASADNILTHLDQIDANSREIAVLQNDFGTLEQRVTAAEEDIVILKAFLDDLGLSVVEGVLNVTYKEE